MKLISSGNAAYSELFFLFLSLLFSHIKL